MDQDILVDGQIEAAGDLVAELLANRIDLSVAFWAKRSDGGAWTLYLGIPSLDRAAMSSVIRAIFLALDRLAPIAIRFSDIQLIDSKDAVGKEAIEILKRSTAGSVVRYQGRSIGDLMIDDAYLLPRMDGPLTEVEVAKAAFGLMTRSGLLAPSILILKDGTRLQGTPSGVHFKSTDGFQIVWHDLQTNKDRTIPANEVVSIWMAPPVADRSLQGATP